MSFPFIPPRGKEEEAIKEYRSNIREQTPYLVGAAATAAAAILPPPAAAAAAAAKPTIRRRTKTVAGKVVKRCDLKERPNYPAATAEPTVCSQPFQKRPDAFKCIRMRPSRSERGPNGSEHVQKL